MRSHRALLFGVLIPAAFSHALYSGLTHRRHVHRSWRYERTFASPDFMAPPPPPPWAPMTPPTAVTPPPMRACAVRAVRTLSAPASSSDQIDLATTGAGEVHMDGVT